MSRESLIPAHPVAGSRVITDYGRVADDWYVEPRWVTRRLVERLRFEGRIHDPCCGEGNIPQILRQMGFEATGADAADRGWGEVRDFFADHEVYENIICNPPYRNAEEFIRHGLRGCQRKFAAFVNLKFLASQVRRNRLFKPLPPSWVLVLSERPSVPPGGMGITAKGGTADYCWIIWERGVEETRIDWI